MKKDNGEKLNYMSEYAKYSALVFQMIALAALGVLGGIQVDKWLKMKTPVFTLLLTIVMTLLALFHLFRTILKNKH